jgi:hypothetical protein
MENNQVLVQALQQEFASFRLFFSVLYERALPPFGAIAPSAQCEIYIHSEIFSNQALPTSLHNINNVLPLIFKEF